MHQSPEEAPTSASGSGSTEPLSASALARRRALFKGIGKGGAAIAASVPIQTLAGQTLLTAGGQHICSVSGMQSGVHSATTNVAYCGGYSPAWWGQTKDGLSPSRTWPTLPSSWTYATKCNVVFTRSTLKIGETAISPSLFEVMCAKDSKLSKFANTDEFHWICAWLNALSHSFNFPYSGQQVIDFYNDLSRYDAALDFFKTYMEQHTS